MNMSAEFIVLQAAVYSSPQSGGVDYSREHQGEASVGLAKADPAVHC